MNIGLTGGIACGKSTVATMLEQRGAIVIDADQIAREVVLPGMPALGRIAERFGPAVLAPDGTLDRKRLGAIVFSDEAARRDLEAILHPPIRALMRERKEHFELASPDKLVVLDIPLLYESKLEPMVSRVMVVYCPRKVQLERLVQRDKLTAEQAEARLAAQLPIEDKRRMADIVIDNSGTLEHTQRQVDTFWSSLPLT
ncbi:dephospho-CoA kinase [Gordoniibacillus kamchatkensis]|uniref:Dephospho-CoA kinase n=1 Tax=Gordoniibacillus kamchatkensis TaxID=1590651 RepID=A0ABR5ALJ3_9BACL|nr:dephospho-CoA kinase [Paenibacillus sp. VKM B-2647]KIL41688.1 dephospho-CoA kinase [Paenibacillus sp. VKM B-2647]